MKRCLTLLLAAVFMVAVLTACGRNKDQQNSGETNSAVTDNGSGGSQSSSNSQNGNSQSGNTQNGNSQNSGQTGNDGNTHAGNDSLLEDAGDMIQDGVNGMENALDDATGNTQARAGGSSYQQMLRNARVHDRDGDLTDRENSVTTGY